MAIKGVRYLTESLNLRGLKNTYPKLWHFDLCTNFKFRFIGWFKLFFTSLQHGMTKDDQNVKYIIESLENPKLANYVVCSNWWCLTECIWSTLRVNNRFHAFFSAVWVERGKEYVGEIEKKFSRGISIFKFFLFRVYILKRKNFSVVFNFLDYFMGRKNVQHKGQICFVSFYSTLKEGKMYNKGILLYHTLFPSILGIDN